MIRKLANNMEHIAGGNICKVGTPKGKFYCVDVPKSVDVPKLK